jgi:hypothetical protein
MPVCERQNAITIGDTAESIRDPQLTTRCKSRPLLGKTVWLFDN